MLLRVLLPLLLAQHRYDVQFRHLLPWKRNLTAVQLLHTKDWIARLDPSRSLLVQVIALRPHTLRRCLTRPFMMNYTVPGLSPQVGANDHSGNAHGKDWGLFATSSGWNALLIEPMPSAFDRLQERYGKVPRVRLMNSAVCDSCAAPAQVCSNISGGKQ